MSKNHVIRVAFGICFAVGLFMAAQAQIAPPPGGGVPGGATTQVQFNDAGVFNGNPNILINKTNNILTFGGITASFSGLKQCGQAIVTNRICVRLGDDSDWGFFALVGFDLMLAGNRTGFIDSGGSGIRISATNSGGGIIIDATTTGGNGLIKLSGTLADTTQSFQTPTTGFSITLSNVIWHTILDPAGTLATGTITMPAAPIDGQIVNVRSSQVITSLTVSANAGQSIKGNPTSLAVGGTFECLYRNANTTWYC